MCVANKMVFMKRSYIMVVRRRSPISKKNTFWYTRVPKCALDFTALIYSAHLRRYLAAATAAAASMAAFFTALGGNRESFASRRRLPLSLPKSLP